MKITKQIAMQGDVQIYAIDSIPKDLKKVEKQFIAASERTGSMHALFGNYDSYPTEGGFVINVKEDCILNHSLQKHLAGISMDQVKELPKKDHDHTVVRKGKYFFGIQQRFDPLLAMKVKVKD